MNRQQLISLLTLRFLGKIHVGIECRPEALCVSSQWHSLLISHHLKGPNTQFLLFITILILTYLFPSSKQNVLSSRPGLLIGWNTLRNCLLLLHLDFFPMVIFSLKGTRSAPPEPPLFLSPGGGRGAVSGTLGF